MKKNKKIIGILGGMGPQASAQMLDEVISIAASKFKATDCDDFPEIVLFSLPVPDFIASKKNLGKALLMFQKKIRLMEKINVSRAAMACNTAHIVFKELQNSSTIPLISMINEVTKEVSKQKISKVGLLASPNTVKSGLFRQALQKRGIEILVPTQKQEEEVETIIRKVIANKTKNQDSQKLVSIALAMEKCGAKGIILGCTELPLVFPKTFSLPVFDSIKITAEALLIND